MIKNIRQTLTITTFLFTFFLAFYPQNSKAAPISPAIACDVPEDEVLYLLEQVRINNKPQIRSMDDCKKRSHALFARIIDADPRYFEYAADNLKDDEVFIGKFAALNPEVLKYISPRLATNRHFMFKMVRIYPEALEYASQKLVNNKDFMTQMIKINPNNFAYASDRLQDDEATALLALRKNGKMLKYASPRLQSDKKIVMEAIKSYSLAINFASERLQKNKEVRKLSSQINYKFLEDFENFLRENYGGLSVGPEGFRGYHIVNMAKFFPDNQITYHPYVTKWEQVYKNGVATEEIRLATKSINDGGWGADFQEYPELIEAIEEIFVSNHVDPNTMDGLNTVSLWKVSSNPTVIAFDLYLLRQIDSPYTKASTANVVALSAIAREIKTKGKTKWEISVVDSIFDADIKMSIAYENGHRRYKVWDLYKVDEKDKNPKVLYKVEDKDGEYFELFAKQLNNRYVSIYKGGGYAMDINLFENVRTDY